MPRWLFTLIVALSVSACGGLADKIEYADDALDARDRNARVVALANTAIAAMPEAGSVRYTGHATLAYGTVGAEVILLGDVAVTADFADGSVTGRVDNVFGGTGVSDVQDYAGALTFDGTIAVRRANSFDAVIAGQVAGAGQTLVLRGPFVGDFRGVGGRALVGMTTQGLDATLNGAKVPMRVRVVAEQ